MRDILFKAKRIDNGEWVEGYYCEGTCNSNCGISLIITELNVEIPYRSVLASATDIEDIRDFDIYEVDEETICQYTGLKDKNGNKIWENDIVNKVDTNGLGYHRERKCKVSFDELGYWLLTTEYGDGYWLGEFDSQQLEVIGNIFDNPELLNYVDNEVSQQAHQEVLKSAT